MSTEFGFMEFGFAEFGSTVTLRIKIGNLLREYTYGYIKIGSEIRVIDRVYIKIGNQLMSL